MDFKDTIICPYKIEDDLSQKEPSKMHYARVPNDGYVR